MVNKVSKLEDLEQAFLAKDEGFNSEDVYEFMFDNLPIRVRARSKAGGLSHAPNIYVKLIISNGFFNMVENLAVDVPFTADDVPNESDFGRAITEISQLIQQNSKASNPTFKMKEKANNEVILDCSVERKE